MVGINDLYDMSATFTRMRAEIKYEKNIEILKKIEQILIIRDTYEYNQIRNAIAEISEIDHEKWNFAFHQNFYVYHAFLKNPSINNILVKVCESLITILQHNEFEKAYDLADAIHCLPDIIAENHFTIPKSYWKCHIQIYRNKWDKYFLRDEQRTSR